MWLHSRATDRPLWFQPVPHDWCNKGRGMCYPVFEIVHIKKTLLLIDKKKKSHVVAAADFLSRFLDDPLPYLYGRNVHH